MNTKRIYFEIQFFLSEREREFINVEAMLTPKKLWKMISIERKFSSNFGNGWFRKFKLHQELREISLEEILFYDVAQLISINELWLGKRAIIQQTMRRRETAWIERQ